MNNIRPEHFFGDKVPPRIIGTETEYVTQVVDAKGSPFSGNVNEKLRQRFSKVSGLKSCESPRGMTLQNGANIHNDVGHIEYAGPESLGPRQAAAADFAGIIIMQRLGGVISSNCAIYRRAGTNFADEYCDSNDTMHAYENLTSGYHENYLIPSIMARPQLLGKILPTFLATRIWSGAGSVGQDGFHLSQKAPGIGKLYSTNLDNRTSAHKKPMYLIRSQALNNDGDINPLYQWSRIEVRYADPGQSKASRFLALGATSLVLRMLEHPRIVGKQINYLQASSPIKVKAMVDRDLDFSATFNSIHNKQLTALNVQEKLAEIAIKLSDEIQLPADEVEAAYQWRQLIDDFRRCDPSTHDYSPISDVADFAPKLHFLVRTLGIENVHNHNRQALQHDLVWDRIKPVGYAQLYWRKIGGRQDLVPQSQIDELVNLPPDGTRAALRGYRIRKNQAREASWTNVSLHSGTEESLNDPYSNRHAS